LVTYIFVALLDPQVIQLLQQQWLRVHRFLVQILYLGQLAGRTQRRQHSACTQLAVFIYCWKVLGVCSRQMARGVWRHLLVVLRRVGALNLIVVAWVDAKTW